MKTCPWCEGKGVVGKLVPDQEGRPVRLHGRALETLVLVDQPCGTCGGTGQVTDDWTQLPKETDHA